MKNNYMQATIYLFTNRFFTCKKIIEKTHQKKKKIVDESDYGRISLVARLRNVKKAGKSTFNQVFKNKKFTFQLSKVN